MFDVSESSITSNTGSSTFSAESTRSKNQERKGERDFLTEVRLHVEAGRHRGDVATFPPITRPWKAHMQICQADHAADLRQNIRTFGGTFLDEKLYIEQTKKEIVKKNPLFTLFIFFFFSQTKSIYLK